MARQHLTDPSGYTVLVIDDQDGPLESTKTILERDGHAVLTAMSGEAGLALLRAHAVHLVIVDYRMPAMNGADLVRAVRAFDPYVQIILQTGYAGDSPPLTMLKELDIQGYHSKGDGPAGLLLWVAAALKTHRLISRLVERERLQADLVSNVSHEFRTPLNIIGGYSELLRDGEFGAMPTPALRPLQALIDTNRSLADLVDNFLQFARIDAGVFRVSPAVVAMAPLVQELTQLGRVLLEEKGVPFRVETVDAPESLCTDSVKLRTILRNLIVNAAKFTAAGEVVLSIVRREPGLLFQVRDTGPGIPAADLAAVFEPFLQLDASSTRRHGGVGLGLALARRLACLLGGYLEVASQEGEGSVFSLYVPLRSPEHSAGDAKV